MTRRKSYHRSSYQKRRRSETEFSPEAALILGIGFFGYFTYIKFILPNLERVKFYSILGLIIIVFVLIGYLFYLFDKRKKEKILEQERIKNIPIFIRNLESKIKEFTPIKEYKEEKLYQTELVGFLKNNYPNLKIEETIDYSRPDIIIDNVAIEIKGPTTMSGLKTLPDKINSYLPKWDYLFIVLFNIHVIDDEEKNIELYEKKKNEILANTIEVKRDKIFFIEYF